MKYLKLIVMVIAVFSPISLSYAGVGVGTVTKVLVGRMGNEVYVSVAGNINAFPCASAHPNGWNYAISLTNNPAGKDILSALLVAYTAGKTVEVQGVGTCTIDSTLEDIGYVILR